MECCTTIKLQDLDASSWVSYGVMLMKFSGLSYMGQIAGNQNF